MTDNVWVLESSEVPPVCKKRKRRVGRRKIEFDEWGSRPLMEFLEAIGKDTTKKHSQNEVAAFIMKYINDKALTSPEGKKKILCDDRLCALLGRKSVCRKKIYNMLQDHFTENHDDSDDDHLENSEEETRREKKNNPTGQMKQVPVFAAVIPENIKLIYLKRSLIRELEKFPESFECKVVGSFVRMKSDPNDIYQKNYFQLQLVTGVEKVSEGGDAGSEIRLTVANLSQHVPISKLCDVNFLEEEVEDVRRRIKAGLLKKLTVIELELKAQMLHADITNHWIGKELSLLQNRMDHVNDKGRRGEFNEYRNRRELLQTRSEKERLLREIPKVVAEEPEPGTVAEGCSYSPKTILPGSSDVSSKDVSGFEELVIYHASSYYQWFTCSKRAHGGTVNYFVLVIGGIDNNKSTRQWRCRRFILRTTYEVLAS